MKKAFRGLAALAAVGALALSGCSAESGSTGGASGELQTVTEGKLTIATGEPAYEPWVVNDDPASGEGFEAAVAYAVAKELGFDPEDVVWVRTTFDSAIAPGPKDWDFNLQQFSITEERKQAVDFSSAYYVTTQAVVTVEGSPAAEATSISDLKGVNVGVASGTTSYTLAAEKLGEDALSVFNNNDDVVLALQSNQIDALVVDLPTAFYLAAAVLDGGIVLGQFEGTDGGDEFGLVLPKGSPLTAAVTAAVDRLREKGTLAELEATWLSEAVSVPVLK
ncbi:MAG: ABC transporter substrate-binding protein [Actinomycetes bacterium]|nr:MAG: amino acid ABC transporter substrate-binding protein [Actinomycetota bacterium]